MPRYFFIVETPTRRYGDEGGAALPDDDAALARAQAIVEELKSGGDCDGWSVIVQDDSGRIVSSIPIYPLQS
jgi:hypothetical protein